MNKWQNWDGHGATILVFLNFSEGFEATDHGVLPGAWTRSGSVVLWCFSFSMAVPVNVEEERLSLKLLICGVPPGLFIDPQLLYTSCTCWIKRPSWSWEDMHALVTSWVIDYNALYVGLPLKTILNLQLVQNEAAQAVTGKPSYPHISPLLCELHWLLLSFWVQFKVLCITCESLHDIGPDYLRKHLSSILFGHPVLSHIARKHNSVVWNRIPKDFYNPHLKGFSP